MHYQLCKAPFFVTLTDKLRPSRSLQMLGAAEEASEDSTAAVRQARSAGRNNADGALAAAVLLDFHDDGEYHRPPSCLFIQELTKSFPHLGFNYRPLSDAACFAPIQHRFYPVLRFAH